MIENTIVERVSEDGLNRHAYSFWFDEFWKQLVLDEYVDQTRPSKRHAWVTRLSYHRLSHRRRNEISMPRESVEIPPGVAEEARRIFLSTILIYVDGEPKPQP